MPGVTSALFSMVGSTDHMGSVLWVSPLRCLQTGCHDKVTFRVSYLDQQGLGVILNATDPGVVGSVFDPRQGGLPGGHARAQEHGADGIVCTTTRVSLYVMTNTFHYNNFKMTASNSCFSQMDLDFSLVSNYWMDQCPHTCGPS
jgi:hypothetical protein